MNWSAASFSIRFTIACSSSQLCSAGTTRTSTPGGASRRTRA
jgi:hypothetical protein